MNPLGIGVSITSCYVSSKAVSYKIKSIDVQNFPPFLDWLDVILYCLFGCKVFGEISTRRVAESVDVQRMNLEMRHQVFEHFIKSHGSSAKSVEQHQMGKVGLAFGINLVDVLIFGDADISETDFFVECEFGCRNNFFVVFECGFIQIRHIVHQISESLHFGERRCAFFWHLISLFLIL